MKYLNSKADFEFLLTLYLGRDGIWTVCTVTDPDAVFLTMASEPYFNQRSDPIYVRRLREHECDWNSNHFNCLMPVTYSRLNRVVTVIPQTIDLYEVFEPEDSCSEVNHML